MVLCLQYDAILTSHDYLCFHIEYAFLFQTNRVPAYWLGLRWGMFTCVGWQVTLCDPIWQVTSRSSEMGFPWSAIHSFNLFSKVDQRCHFQFICTEQLTKLQLLKKKQSRFIGTPCTQSVYLQTRVIRWTQWTCWPGRQIRQSSGWLRHHCHECWACRHMAHGPVEWCRMTAVDTVTSLTTTEQLP